MANKTVSSIIIALETKGAERIGGLKSSLRELGKASTLSGKELAQLRKDILEVGEGLSDSEQAIKGQISALEGLQKQVSQSGFIYSDLNKDIERLKAGLNGSTPAIDAQRKSILELAGAAGATSNQLASAVQNLSALRNETRLDSAAFNALGKDIVALNEKIASLAEQTTKTASENRAAAASVNAVLAKYEASAQSQAKLAADREKTVRDEVVALSSKKKVTDDLIKKENQLTAAIARRKQLSVQEGAREARRRVRAGAQIYTGATELGPVDAFDQRLGDLPQTTAAFSQRLSELQDRLVNTVRGGEQYIAVALRIAQVQREATKAAQGLGAALLSDLSSGVAAKSQKNLREVIGQLQAEMSELNTETAEGSAKYAENARQVNNLQKELDQIANSYRNVSDMTRRAISSQVDYGAVARKMFLERDRPGYKTPAEIRGSEFLERVNAESQAMRQTLALPAAGQTSAPGTGAERSGMARGPLPYATDAQGRRVLKAGAAEVTFREPVAASFYPPLAGRAKARQESLPAAEVGVAPNVGLSNKAIEAQASALQKAAQAYGPYNRAIRQARAANNGSITSINKLKNALIAKRNELPTTSAAFKRLSKEIEDLDRKTQKAGARRRMSPMQMTQAAGAAISGGIFGGPEGFLGGVIGSIGGVGGAFAGAAVGAQVGGLRRQMGEFADYSAQIDRLKIALKGITEIQGDASLSQANYSQALAAAAKATADLNIPQEVAIQGMTRLTAAVKGAGGGVTDAELAFKNINSAIIATGGGAEEVQGAITALVQIFSKGKVSAEEINQIAERLPGTFNKIAQASGRTGPELTKALEQGEVGLNDLMKFLVQLGDEYNDLALQLAESSQSAGARMERAFDKMRKDVGEALQPLGAEFQNAFKEFIVEITPSLVSAAKSVSEALQFILQNRDVIGMLASTALKFAAVNLAIKGFIALKGPVVAMFALLRSGFKATSQNAVMAQTKLVAFGKTVKLMAASLAAPIVITFAIVGAELVISYFNRIKKAKADLDATASKPQGEAFFRSIGGTAATKRTLQRNINDIMKNLDILRDRVKATKKEIASYNRADNYFPGERASGGAAPPPQTAVPEDLKARLKADEAEIKRLTLNYRTIIDRLLEAPDVASPKVTDFPLPAAEDKDSKKKTKKRAAKVKDPFAAGNRLLLEQEREFALAEETNELQRERLRITFELDDKIKDINKNVHETQRAEAESNAIRLANIEFSRKAGEYLAEGVQEQLQKIAAVQRENEEYQKRIEQIDQMRIFVGELSQEEYDRNKALEAAKELLGDQTPLYEKVKAKLEEMATPLGKFKTGLQELITESGNLADNLAGAGVQAISQLGEELSNFVATGKADFRSLTVSILQDMARIAAQSAFTNALRGVINIFSGGSSSPAPFGVAPTGKAFDLALNANGNVFAQNKIVPYAMGGVVKKPTLFQFADGGAGRLGIMGEAGAEAILPLKRGADGKLGVEAQGGGVGNIVVNVDAKGTTTEGNAPNANMLGKLIGNAVQAELVKQRRPGGILS